MRMVADFYRSPGVLHPIPAAHAERTFDELMRSTAYAEAFIFEHEGRIAGYGLLAKTFSQEAARQFWHSSVTRYCLVGQEWQA